MQSLRYLHLPMKKLNPTKLTVRRETLRALAGIELTRAAGGGAEDALPRETGAAMCPGTAVIQLPGD
jgi:hypothetical protein